MRPGPGAMDDFRRRRRNAAWRGTLAYAALSVLWIVGSDVALDWLFPDPARHLQFSILKGALFVGISAALIFLLVWRAYGPLAELLARDHPMPPGTRGEFGHQLIARHLDAFWRHANDIVFLADTRGVLMDVNDRAVQRLGKSREALIGMRAGDLRAPEERARFDDSIQRILSEDGAVYETRYLDAEGRSFPVEVSASIVEVEGQRFLQAILRDISERRAAEARLRDSEARFRALAEVSPAGIFRTDRSGACVYANQRFTDLTGLPVERALGDGWLDAIVPAQREQVRKRMRRMGARGEPIEMEMQYLRADGTTGWVLSVGKPEVDGAGQVSGYIGAMLDITARKDVEQQQALSSAKIETAMMGTVRAIAQMVELRDPYTAGHERRVADIAVAIAAEMGMDAEALRGLRVIGQLHDIRKIAVPAEILARPGKLNSSEMEIVRGHAQAGHAILNDIDFPWPVADAILQHHERIDGSGYPLGLKGEEILEEARILAVADTVEAISSHRPYRSGLGIVRALQEIEAGAGRIYCPEAAAACLRLFREKGYAIPE